MNLTFSVRTDGIIDVSLGDEWRLFNQALEDSVSSRAPRGAHRPGLSTYWIDRTEAAVQAAAAEGSTDPFASGNVTFLRLNGDAVVAAFDFDPEGGDVEEIPLEDFLALLKEWRKRVIDAGGTHGVDAQLGTEPTPRPLGPATN